MTRVVKTTVVGTSVWDPDRGCLVLSQPLDPEFNEMESLLVMRSTDFLAMAATWTEVLRLLRETATCGKPGCECWHCRVHAFLATHEEK